jgi:anti-sigma B factor antagonist
MALTINANNNTEKGVWEFKLIGEVDISNAHLFKKQLEAAITERKQNISIDLSELSYIDSTGLGVIIGAYGSIKKDGYGVKVANPRDNVKKLLNISGLDKILC